MPPSHSHQTRIARYTYDPIPVSPDTASDFSMYTNHGLFAFLFRPAFLYETNT